MSGPLARVLSDLSVSELLDVLVMASPDVRAVVAGSDMCPPQAMRLLAEDDTSDVRQTVADNAACPPDLIAGLLVHDEDVLVRRRATTHPHAPHDALIRACDDPDIEVRRSLAERADLPADGAGLLADDETVEVRVALARNPAGLAAADRLANDSSVEVRVALLRHVELPAALVRRICEQDVETHAPYVIGHSNITTALLAELATHPNITVRETVAKNGHRCDPDTQWTLACDEDVRVPVALLERQRRGGRDLSPEAMCRLAIDPREDVAAAVRVVMPRHGVVGVAGSLDLDRRQRWVVRRQDTSERLLLAVLDLGGDMALEEMAKSQHVDKDLRVMAGLRRMGGGLPGGSNAMVVAG